jgi:cardiolipin synthase
MASRNGCIRVRFSVPNLLTLIRIVITPLVIIFLIQRRFLEAFLVFTTAGVTDALDGLLARWLKQKTRIGAILDPMADKLLLASSFVTMAVIGLLPGWLAVVVISRDIIILVGVLILFLLQGGVEIRPSVLSKLTTLAQLGTVFFTFVNHEFGWLKTLIPSLCICTAVITVGSGLQYMVRGVRLLGSEENSKGSG